MSDAQPYVRQLEKIREDADYTAQGYFEAAKSAEFWGRTIVFVPAVLGALGGLLVALGLPKEIGAVSAVAGVIAATASFLGSEKRAASFKDSARRFTQIRHRTGMEIDLSSRAVDEATLNTTVRDLRQDYDTIVGTSEPIPNRSFKRAQKRISGGVLDYDSEDNSSMADQGSGDVHSKPATP